MSHDHIFAETIRRRDGARRCRRARCGFTLIELLVVLGIIVVLMSLLMPAIVRAREQANRIKCAANLREIMVAMMMYSNNEHDHGFPRAVYTPGQQLQLDNAGYLIPDTFGHSGYVGDNNVPASLFLLFKAEKLSPMLLICPSTDAQPAFVNVDRELSSNWEDFPKSVSYSLATPYPSPAADKRGFVWKNKLSPQFAYLADINPGTRGGANPPNNVVGPAHEAPAAAMAAANSNNHRNQGQNVVYGDGHVEFQTTPYCGAVHRDTGIRDNIYTAGNGDGGLTGNKALPVDASDSVMFPTDDPGGQ